MHKWSHRIVLIRVYLHTVIARYVRLLIFIVSAVECVCLQLFQKLFPTQQLTAFICPIIMAATITMLLTGGSTLLLNVQKLPLLAKIVAEGGLYVKSGIHFSMSEHIRENIKFNMLRCSYFHNAFTHTASFRKVESEKSLWNNHQHISYALSNI
jgi:hypothetical protein